VPALENVAVWHERDISHSSVERAIGPDTTVTLDFALARLAGMMDRLLVYPERMRANLDSLGGVVYSGDVLLALARSGLSREDAYSITQRCAMATWTKLGTPEGRSFRENLLHDPDVKGRMSAAELDAALDPATHTRSVDRIFARVFGEAS
jgi:adenylosuccinate lyase